MVENCKKKFFFKICDEKCKLKKTFPYNITTKTTYLFFFSFLILHFTDEKPRLIVSHAICDWTFHGIFSPHGTPVVPSTSSPAAPNSTSYIIYHDLAQPNLNYSKSSALFKINLT